MDRDVYIANGAGFSGDRFDAAVPLVAHLATCSGPRYLMFEVLADARLPLRKTQRQRTLVRAIRLTLKIICAQYYTMFKNTR